MTTKRVSINYILRFGPLSRKPIKGRQYPSQDVERLWRTAGYKHVYRDHLVDAANYGIAVFEHAAVVGTVADCNHDFWIRRGVVSAPEWFRHVACYGTCHQKAVGVSRRGDEM